MAIAGNGRTFQGSGDLPAFVGSSFQFFAQDWGSEITGAAITTLAPAQLDEDNAAVIVRTFDDTTAEGTPPVTLRVPVGASTVQVTLVGRVKTAPGVAKGVGVKVSARSIVAGSLNPTAWVSVSLNAITTPTTEVFLTATQDVTLSSLSISSGGFVQLQISRDPDLVADNLVADFYLLFTEFLFY